MKSIVDQLSNYKSVHLNKHNVYTHFFGIPLIIWAVAVLLNTITFEVMIAEQSITIGLATIIGLAALCYYLVLYIPLALMIALLFGPLIYSTHWVLANEYVYTIAISTFVIGWVLQFIGHAYEKAKPAFFDDINQLLIGPLFLIAEVYFALGLNNNMAKEVHELAVEKRKQFELAKQR